MTLKMNYFNNELVFIPENEVVVSIEKRTKSLSLNYNDLKVGKKYLIFTISQYLTAYKPRRQREKVIDKFEIILKEIKDDVLYFENEKKETVVINSVNLSKKFEDMNGHKIDILDYFYDKDVKDYQKDLENIPNYPMKLRFSNFSFSDKGKIERYKGKIERI
jgi:hypothetical protein